MDLKTFRGRWCFYTGPGHADFKWAARRIEYLEGLIQEAIVAGNSIGPEHEAYYAIMNVLTGNDDDDDSR